MTSLQFKPPIIAHRGSSFYAPENTIAAFTKAMQLGVKWVEFDVMQAACGEPIIFHDDTLERTTNGSGRVIDYPYAYLQSLDAGSWFNPFFSGEKIPTLAETMAFLQHTQMSANVELKPLPGREEELVLHVLQTIDCFKTTLRGNILFSSFSVPALQALRKLSKDCYIGLLLHDWEQNWQIIAEALQCISIHVYNEILTEDASHKIKASGRELLCYTVNDPDEAKELFSWGVDAIFTDKPNIMLEAFPG